jgi:molybdopterin-guanine dinucleotide biosynthesis protein A
VIAGGSSSRYGGVPKGLLEVGGRRILDRVVEVLERATGGVPVLIANAPEAVDWRPGLPIAADVLPGHGSLGGILTAVETVGAALCVAWDMPFVPAELLAELAGLLAGADAALPESDSRRGLEPLCAAYGPACGPAIRAAIARGDARAVGFHPDVRVARLPRDAVLQYGDPTVLFFNVNGPDDLARAELLCRNHDSYR